VWEALPVAVTLLAKLSGSLLHTNLLMTIRWSIIKEGCPLSAGHAFVTWPGQGTYITFKHCDTRYCNASPCRYRIKPGQ